jgi:hypothetical protein
LSDAGTVVLEWTAHWTLPVLEYIRFYFGNTLLLFLSLNAQTHPIASGILLLLNLIPSRDDWEMTLQSKPWYELLSFIPVKKLQTSKAHFQARSYPARAFKPK